MFDLIAVLRQKLNQEEVTFEGSASKGSTGVDGLGLNQFSRRYIYHLLARTTAFVERNAGKPDLFDKYVDRKSRNPYDIEHIWADKYDRYQPECSTQQDFQDWRNHVAGLLLLPADVNRSLQDKPYDQKAPHYAKQNLYAASLTAATYEHEPQFKQFRTANNLPFKPYESFGKAEQTERRELVEKLVNLVWSPSRLDEFLS